MPDRSGLVTLRDKPVTLTGDGVVGVGDVAPDFKAKKSLADFVSLKDYAGKRVILNVVPSLDTPVCSTQTARFNKAASELGADVVVLTLSMDLPMAQARWCGANSATAVTCLSDYHGNDFGKKFGLIIKELGVLARAVYVIGADGKVKHAEIVKEIATEPNYDAALAAAKA